MTTIGIRSKVTTINNKLSRASVEDPVRLASILRDTLSALASITKEIDRVDREITQLKRTK